MTDLMMILAGANVPCQKFIKEFKTWLRMILPLKKRGWGFSFAQDSSGK